MTKSIKLLVGRLRPHFLDVYRPEVNCTLEENIHLYLMDYSCEGIDISLDSSSRVRLMRETGMSFPSGYSSSAIYTAVWLTMFIQARWTWKTTFMVKNLVQFLLILSAVFTGITRFVEYQNHWSDILSGFVIGTLVAVLVAIWGW